MKIIYICAQWILMLGMDPQGLSVPSDSRMKTTHLGSPSHYLATTFCFSRNCCTTETTALNRLCYFRGSQVSQLSGEQAYRSLSSGKHVPPKADGPRSPPPLIVQIPLSTFQSCCPQMLSHVIHMCHFTIDGWKREDKKP